VHRRRAGHGRDIRTGRVIAAPQEHRHGARPYRA